METRAKLLTMVVFVVLLLSAPLAQADADAQAVNDFEGALWTGFDPDGAGIGLVAWGDSPENATLSIRQLIPHSTLAVPGKEAAANDVLAIAYNINSWGGFSDAFTDGVNWTTQDWSAFKSIRFWLYGNATGSTIQMDILENRNPEVKGDSAERWFYRFDDDYQGWKQFTIPFAAFQRRSDFQPSGAPNDGLGLTEVSGYAFIFPAGVGAQVAYLDDVSVVNGVDTMTGVTPTAESTVEVDTSITWDSREWVQAWSDEFDGAAGMQVNGANWTAEIGGNGWGNNELEYYTDRPENAALDGNGNLAIVAREENPADYQCHYGTCRYTSARLITKGQQAFTYGRVEARIKIPRGQGVWPAFWMLGTDIDQVGWPNSGEIDIMENIGKEPQIVHGTIHGPGYSAGNGITAAFTGAEDFADDFHVYAIDWDPQTIRWYVDGNLYSTVSVNDLHGRKWVYDHDFFILLNVAVGGQWPGMPDSSSQFPQTMLVDYVRVYKLASDS